MFKSFRESSSVCTLADRQLEQAINAKLERGRVAVYSTPSSYGLVFSWTGRNHTVEQESPFDADEVVTKATEWADKLENSGLPKGWSRTP
jgi:hypothetical protein